MTTLLTLRDGSQVPFLTYAQSKTSIDQLFNERQGAALLELFRKCKDDSYQFCELISAFNSRETLKKSKLIQEVHHPLDFLYISKKSSPQVKVNEDVRKIVLNYLEFFNEGVERVNPLSSKFQVESKKNQ